MVYGPFLLNNIFLKTALISCLFYNKNLGEDLIGIVDIIIGAIVVFKGGKLLIKATKETAESLKVHIDDLIGKRNKELESINPNFLLPKRKKWRQLVDDIDSDKEKLHKKGKSKQDFTRHTNYSELKTILHYESRKWTIGNNTGRLKYIGKNIVESLDDPFKKGIDAIYEFSNPPPKYIVSEVKFNTKNKIKWKASISRDVTKSGASQMMEEWIEFNLFDSVDNATFDDIMKKGYSRVLTSLDKGKVITQELNEVARIINKKNKFIK
jgi:predicted DNA-binding protein (MmcQ/YjbR family)